MCPWLEKNKLFDKYYCIELVKTFVKKCTDE